MKYRKTLLSASIFAAFCIAGTAFAQDSAQHTGKKSDKEKAAQLQTITVTGIRNSEALSLQLKKYANSHVEVVTAEDIGKLPAKNVADTLERLPGVNISSASAHEGGFDENDRVSLRGTNPNLTETLVDGHNIGTGDWFVLSQVQTVGRSVSYSLLPAEIVSEVVVHKSSEARLVEGGAAGTVNIITRKPLEFDKPVTVVGSVGGVYSDLPGSTKPQASALFNWKNADNTFGVLVQGFYEQRELQRNGQEVVGGYSQISASDPVVATHPDLAGVYYPNEIGAAFFTQKRTREGGVIDLQFKPTDNLSLDLNGFYSKLKADNVNRNYMMWASKFVPYVAPDNYSVKNGVLTNASYGAITDTSVMCGASPCATTPYGIYDQISRPGASSESKYLTLDADWRVSSALSFKFQAGTTRGSGKSPTQDVIELGENAGAGASWNMRGTGQPINWTLGGDNSSPSGAIPSAGWIFGEQGINVKDNEDWGKVDGEFDFDSGALSSLQFGVRYADHKRESLNDIAQGPDFSTNWTDLSAYPTSHQNYPSDFGSSLGGTVPSNIWYYTAAQLKQIDAQFANRDPVTRFYFNDIYAVKEKDSAAYFQANFEGDRWSGNIGVRYVHTAENIQYASTAPDALASSVEGPITGSAFGNYYWNTYKHSYGKWLPSANLKFNLTDQVVARFAASQTLTRPNYSALSGFVSADDLTHTGNGGNPKLKPLISTNFDAALEWYFAPRGLLSASVYQMELKDYVGFGNQVRSLKDMTATANSGTPVFSNYLITVPTNVNGAVKGVELDYEQPIGKNFGVQVNYTYASGHADGNTPLQGTSKNTFNASAYFENDRFSARVGYTYRSSFYDGVLRTDNFYQAGEGNLSASLGYTVTKWMTLSLDAMNLNNPHLRYYTENANYGRQPSAQYVNGRQYYLTARFKF